ncbi:hypothetical protein M2336_003615 [Sphingobium sp. B1D7B]|nr:hypothetical protein [Sphingobium sp. B1D7B]
MDEAMEVLQQACARSAQGKQDGPDVRLALKALRFLGVPNEALKYFWDSCTSETEIGRSQNMNAALRRIERLRDGKPTA